jgi:hypothetical protein
LGTRSSFGKKKKKKERKKERKKEIEIAQAHVVVRAGDQIIIIISGTGALHIPATVSGETLPSFRAPLDKYTNCSYCVLRHHDHPRVANYRLHHWLMTPLLEFCSVDQADPRTKIWSLSCLVAALGHSSSPFLIVLALAYT